ncbi:helix-turn-helix transcriptional regulator [Salinigranum sp. GCM10025319]|uniref:helix-turn-helix transcriptional regulator n=1 Tax=Salinigranum sp. GCM10025319 TaxID=3252687 RepID=UPI00361EC68D
MRSAAPIFALLIILSGVAPAAALVPTGVDDGQEPATATGLAPQPVIAQTQADADEPSTEIRIQLEADTDARWTVVYRYDLTTEDEVEAFRTLAREYENGGSDVGLDVGVFRSVAEQASASTGRSMVIRDIERNATVERNATETNATTGTGTTTATATTTDPETVEGTTGVVRLSFTWTNFLERNDDGSLELGDVFATPSDETWLSSLGADQRLTVVTPPGYVISRTSFPIQQQNGSLIIDGPREFARGERLSVTYRPSDRAEIPWTLITTGVGAVVVLLAIIAGVLFFRGRTSETTPDGTAMTNGGESTATETGGGPAPDSTEPGSPTGPDGDAAGGSEDGDAGDEDEEPDFELLSDEERVQYLLEQRGGRMKQANIVKETGWSDAKVSQLLSAMADEGRVEKLRLGRENLISLPDESVVDDEDE